MRNKEKCKTKRGRNIISICITSATLIAIIIFSGNMDFEIERILANKGIIKPGFS